MATTTRVLSAAVSGSVYTTNINDALEAIDTCHSGTTAPTDEVANGKFWLDTNTTPAILKVYNNATWQVVVNTTNVTTAGALMDSEVTNLAQVKALDVALYPTVANNLSDLANAPTAISNLGITATAAELNYTDGVSSNIQTQLNARNAQAASAWTTGTSTTEGIVSPAKVKSAIESLAPSPIKAFVNFNGTSASIAKQSNIASVVRNSIGRYTITFTTAMSDANYIIQGTSRGLTSNHPSLAVSIDGTVSPTTTSFKVVVAQTGGSNSVGNSVDVDMVHIVVIS
tara:strand:+ start:6181 stop:7035 length:855 start_codon:yes stop_codon:yes gene_type:complete